MDNKTVKIMKRIVKSAGARIMGYWGRLGREDIRRKGLVDLVTVADTDAEAWIRKNLAGYFPGSGFIGEESGCGRRNADRTFILDPLDGTTNFIHSVPYFCVSLACIEKGEITAGVVYNPVTHAFYSAVRGKGAFRNGKRLHVSGVSSLQDALVVTGFACVRSGLKPDNVPVFSRVIYKVSGVRRSGSAALDLCSVAEGQMDCFWEMNLNSWDVMAGILMVREAGGKVTDYDGGSDPAVSRRICASNGLLHEEMLKIIRQQD
jgi:myo-inositol-1(or 4)-monophosphatase